MVKILLEHGGDPSLSNEKELTPMDICKDEDILTLMRVERKIDTTTKLRGGRRGRRVGMVGGAGKTDETDHELVGNKRNAGLHTSPSSQGAEDGTATEQVPTSKPISPTSSLKDTPAALRTSSGAITTTPARKPSGIRPQSSKMRSGGFFSGVSSTENVEPAAQRLTRVRDTKASLATSSVTRKDVEGVEQVSEGKTREDQVLEEPLELVKGREGSEKAGVKEEEEEEGKRREEEKEEGESPRGLELSEAMVTERSLLGEEKDLSPSGT